MITRILLALIYVQNRITIPHLAVIQLMRVIKWPRSDLNGSCVNKNVRGNKGFYSNLRAGSQTSTDFYRRFRFFFDLESDPSVAR